MPVKARTSDVRCNSVLAVGMHALVSALYLHASDLRHRAPWNTVFPGSAFSTSYIAIDLRAFLSPPAYVGFVAEHGLI